MRHRMPAPGVARGQLDGLAPHRLGLGIAAGFLQREGVAAADIARSRRAVAEARDDAGAAAGHALRIPADEADRLCQLEGQHVAGRVAQRLFQQGGGLQRLACEPGGERGEIVPLARQGRALRRAKLGRLQAVTGLGDEFGPRQREQHQPPCRMALGEERIRRQRPRQFVGRAARMGEHGLDRRVPMLRRSAGEAGGIPVGVDADHVPFAFRGVQEIEPTVTAASGRWFSRSRRRE